jgi:hypothetical protein
MRSISSFCLLIVTLAVSSVVAAEPSALKVDHRLVAGGQGYFPVAQRLADGRIAVVMRGGATHVGIKGRLDITYSSDQGKTWTKPVVAVDSPIDDRNPAFGQAKGGTLIIGFWRTDKDSFADYSLNDPARPVTTWIARSTDNGKTWAESELDVRDIGYGSPYGKILTVPDGIMLMNVYGYPVREPGAKVEHETDCSHLYRSTDDGKTWKRHATIGTGYNETGLLNLPDGTLLAAMRSAGKKANVWLTRSTDGGATWDKPKEITDPMAHPADMVRLPDGRILMVTGYRSAQLGVRGVIGDAAGNFDWSKRFVLVDDSTNGDTGYPSSVVLDDGRVVTFYYAVGSKTHPDWGTHCGLAEFRPPEAVPGH